MMPGVIEIPAEYAIHCHLPKSSFVNKDSAWKYRATEGKIESLQGDTDDIVDVQAATDALCACKASHVANHPQGSRLFLFMFRVPEYDVPDVSDGYAVFIDGDGVPVSPRDESGKARVISDPRDGSKIISCVQAPDAGKSAEGSTDAAESLHVCILGINRATKKVHVMHIARDADGKPIVPVDNRGELYIYDEETGTLEPSGGVVCDPSGNHVGRRVLEITAHYFLLNESIEFKENADTIANDIAGKIAAMFAKAVHGSQHVRQAILSQMHDKLDQGTFVQDGQDHAVSEALFRDEAGTITLCVPMDQRFSIGVKGSDTTKLVTLKRLPVLIHLE